MMADSHNYAAVRWVSITSAVIHSLIACHALAGLCIQKSPKPTRAQPINLGQLKEVQAQSILKYNHSYKRSLMLVSFGACVVLFKVIFLQSGQASRVPEGHNAASGTSNMINLGVFAFYASNLKRPSTNYSTTFRLAVYGAVSSFGLAALHTTMYTISPQSTNILQFQEICQIFGFLLQTLGFLLHPQRPDMSFGNVPAARINSASAADILSFSWQSNAFKKYTSGKVAAEDLPLLDPSLQAGHLMESLPRYDPEQSLWQWLFNAFSIHLAQQLCLAFLKSTTQLLPQYVLFRFLQTLEDDSTRNETTAVAFAVFYGLSLVVELWVGQVLHWFTMAHFQIPMQAVLSSLVYRKTLNLPNVSEVHGGQHDQGRESKRKAANSLKSIDNHLQMDTGRLSVICSQNVQIPLSLVKLVLTATFVAKLIGWSGLILGMTCMFITMSLSSKLSASYAESYFSLMKYRDQRSNLLSEALQGIRHIRLGGFESHWEKRLLDIRHEEMEQLRWSSIPMCLLVVLSNLGPLILGVLPISIYALYNGSLTASVAFTSIGLLEKLHSSLSILPLTWTYLLECWASCERLEGFLKLPENEDGITISDTVSFKNAMVSWSSNEVETDRNSAFSLTDLSLEFPKGRLSLVTGGTGSGKNLLLSSILGETTIVSGVVKSPARNLTSCTGSGISSIAVVSQPPWLERTCIRENILFGSSFNAARYNQVLKACALEKDLDMFPKGDMTDVGPKGASLSGGQRWRVCLARALYSEAETIVMGDFLSAVDAEVRKYIVEQALSGELTRGRTRILATHHAAMCRSYAGFAAHVSGGRVAKLETLPTEVESGNSNLTDERWASPSEDMSSDLKVTDKHESGKDREMTDENGQQQKGTSAGLMSYLRAGGGFSWLCVMIVIILTEATSVSKTWWLKNWTNELSLEQSSMATKIISDRASATPNSTLYYIRGYAIISLLSALLLGFKCLAVYSIGFKSSMVIFRDMVQSVLRASLDWIDTVPRGQILKRFSSDMMTVDLRLPNTLGYEIELGSKLILIVATGIFVSSYTSACAVCLLFAYWKVSQHCMPIAQQLQRLNSTALSPLYSHLHSTLAPNGLLTIRAFGRVQKYVEHMDRLIDDSTRAAWYSCLCSRWMELRTGMLGVVFEIIIAFGAVSGHLDAGLAGFALAVAKEFSGTMGLLIRKAVVVQNEVGAVHRIAEYNDLPTESVNGQDVPDDWPQRGNLEVQNLSVGYASLPTALNNVSFSADSGQRIGIVGRTGAGKSTLALSLFRVLEARHGRILIDGIDISTLKLRDLRGRVCIIPQDPFLFSGTLRSNLDMTDNFSDNELMEALNVVQLNFPLDNTISVGGLNISQGQRQLVCLARALLAKPRILVLDEATSAVDMDTDYVLQDVMRERFNNCTMIVIAHRLSTIIEFDKVVVLSDGEVAESGRPVDLARRKGKFAELIDNSPDKKELYKRLSTS